MKQDNGNHAATPGPWAIEYDNHGNGSFSEWWNVGPGGSGVGKIWKEPDARLIAATPELLALAEHVANTTAFSPAAYQLLRDEARAVIGKAKGD